MKIHITKGNSKLPKETLNFSLPPIKSCPNATNNCKKWCYAKKSYRQYPNVRVAWNENFKTSKTKEFVKMVKNKINTFKKWSQFRISVSGDFYNQSYYNKWLKIMTSFNDKIFYSYTKNIKLNNKHKPDNFILMFSDDDDKYTISKLKKLKYDGKARVTSYNKIKKGETLCIGDCKICNFCYIKTNKFKRVVFKQH